MEDGEEDSFRHMGRHSTPRRVDRLGLPRLPLYDGTGSEHPVHELVTLLYQDASTIPLDGSLPHVFRKTAEEMEYPARWEPDVKTMDGYRWSGVLAFDVPETGSYALLFPLKEESLPPYTEQRRITDNAKNLSPSQADDVLEEFAGQVLQQLGGDHSFEDVLEDATYIAETEEAAERDVYR